LQLVAAMKEELHMRSTRAGWTILGALVVTALAPSAIAANGRVVQIRRKLDDAAVDPGTTRPQAMDKYLPINIANNNDEAVIGQKIWLQSYIRDGKTDWTGTITAQYFWCLDPNSPFKTTRGYVAFDINRAKLGGPPPLDCFNLEFIWYGGPENDTGTEETIGLEVTFAGEAFYDLADIRVYRPTNTFFWGNGHGAYVFDMDIHHNFDWESQMRAPRIRPLGTELDGRGKNAYIQLLQGGTAASGYRLDPIMPQVRIPGRWLLTSQGNKALDVNNKAPIVPVCEQAVASGQIGTNSGGDQPTLVPTGSDAQGRLLQFDHIYENSEPSTFLVYKPGGVNSIWVPLKVIQWKFAVDAKSDAGHWSGVPGTDRSTRGKRWGHDAERPVEWEPPNWKGIEDARWRTVGEYP